MAKSPKSSHRNTLKLFARAIILFLFLSLLVVVLAILTSCASKTANDTHIPTKLQGTIPRDFPNVWIDRGTEPEEVDHVDYTVVPQVILEGEALYNNYIHEICDSLYPDVDPYLIRSMVQQESDYRADIIGDNGKSFGLMQIQPRWNRERMDSLGVEDLLDPYSNLLVGISLMDYLLKTCPTVEYALMQYNGGPTYALKMYNAGKVSGYATEVLDRFEKLKGGM